MKVIVGLGNPGSKYAGTRHNVGWLVMDPLAERAGWTGRGRRRDYSNVAMGRFRGLDVTLVKPLTYMNESGKAVRKVLAREHAPLGDLLIVADDFALPFGKLRFREGGGAGATTASARSSRSSAPRSSAACGSASAIPPTAVATTSSRVRARRAPAPRRAARRGGRRRRGVGAGRHQQGGERVQQVRAPTGRRRPPGRTRRGRRTARTRRRAQDAHRMAASPAA